MGKLAVLILFFLPFAGCGPRLLPNHTRILRAIPAYTVAQVTSNPQQYIIYAPSAAIAERAADAELGCKKSVCLLTQTGVIYFVERPDVERPH